MQNRATQNISTQLKASPKTQAQLDADRTYQFTKDLFFYLDKIDDLLSFFKRLVSYGLNFVLADGWALLGKMISTVANVPSTPVGKGINDFLERLLVNLGALSIIISGIQLLFLLYKSLYFSLFSREDKYTRSIQFALGAGAIGLTILGILIGAGVLTVSTPVLLIAGSTRSFAEHSSIGLITIYNRFFKKESTEAEKKIQLLKAQLKNNPDDKAVATELTGRLNEQCDNNVKIVNRTHASALTGLTTIGSGFLFSGPLAGAGAIILISAAAFGIVDALVGTITGKNTTRWVVEGMNALCGVFLGRKPLNLTPRTEQEVIADVLAEKARESRQEKRPVQLALNAPTVVTQEVSKQSGKEKEKIEQKLDSGEGKEPVSLAITTRETLAPQAHRFTTSNAHVLQALSYASQNSDALRPIIKRTVFSPRDYSIPEKLLHYAKTAIFKAMQQPNTHRVLMRSVTTQSIEEDKENTEQLRFT